MTCSEMLKCMHDNGKYGIWHKCHENQHFRELHPLRFARSLYYYRIVSQTKIHAHNVQYKNSSKMQKASSSGKACCSFAKLNRAPERLSDICLVLMCHTMAQVTKKIFHLFSSMTMSVG